LLVVSRWPSRRAKGMGSATSTGYNA
jgi:hypothetical protein